MSKAMKQIPNYPGYYATKDGRIWSGENKSNHKKGKFLKPDLVRGYFQVVLYRSGERYRRKVHQLILETFIGFCPANMECCHNNGNPKDNRLDNLRWDTRSNNAKDAVKHGTSAPLHYNGENSSSSKLKESDVRMIIYMWRTGEFMQKEIAKIYNISKAQIERIVNRKNWKHIWS